MGVARDPVAGSGAAPACSARVSKAGSDGPGMALSKWCRESVTSGRTGVDSGANHESNVSIVCYVETFISLIPEEALP
jgi:hypothetical protein